MRALSFIVAADDDGLRSAMCTILRTLGGRVQSARDGHELLTLLCSVLADGTEVDLVITDVHLRRSSGIQVLDTVRVLGIAVPFLLLSEPSIRRIRPLLERMGARVLARPFTAGAFLLSVRQICGLDPPTGGDRVRA